MAAQPTCPIRHRFGKAVRNCPGRAQRWVTWGLLVIWLLFGGLAFAEQINLLAETSSQDEDALSALASSIKPDAPALHLPLSHQDFSAVLDLTTHSRVAAPSPPGLVTSNSSSTLRRHQRISVYRI